MKKRDDRRVPLYRKFALELFALPARRDTQSFAVLRYRPPCDGKARLAQRFDDFLVGERILLIFLANHFKKLLLDRVPRDFFAVSGGCTAAEEPLEREDSSRRLDVFVVYCATYSRHVHVDAVSDLLHLERFDRLWTFVEEVLLVLDDRLGDL